VRPASGCGASVENNNIVSIVSISRRINSVKFRIGDGLDVHENNSIKMEISAIICEIVIQYINRGNLCRLCIYTRAKFFLNYILMFIKFASMKQL